MSSSCPFPLAPICTLVALSLAVTVGCTRSPVPGAADVVTARLLALITAPEPDVRRTAALSLGKIAVPGAVPGLIIGVTDSDPLVREYSAWGLGHVGPEQADVARPYLIRLLMDPIPAVGRAAAAALGKLGGTPESVRAVVEVLRHGDQRARQAAILALAGMEAPEAYAAVVDALEDDDPAVRHGAVAALGELGDRRALPLLAARLRLDRDAGVRSEAAYRLGKLGDLATVSVLEAAREDVSPNVRRWVEWAIAELTTSDGPRSAT